jgi:hypothetical protein
MGMDQTVIFRTTAPTWTAARDLLAARGYPVQMMMIDGQLAFPDEEPPEPWGELRLGTPLGMVTVRRQAARLDFVTWGNADLGLPRRGMPWRGHSQRPVVARSRPRTAHAAPRSFDATRNSRRA